MAASNENSRDSLPPDYLEIVKHPDGWALRRGAGSPNLLTSGDRDLLIAAGRRLAIVFGLPLMVNGEVSVAIEDAGSRGPGNIPGGRR